MWASDAINRNHIALCSCKQVACHKSLRRKCAKCVLGGLSWQLDHARACCRLRACSGIPHARGGRVSASSQSSVKPFITAPPPPSTPSFFFPSHSHHFQHSPPNPSINIIHPHYRFHDQHSRSQTNNQAQQQSSSCVSLPPSSLPSSLASRPPRTRLPLLQT